MKDKSLNIKIEKVEDIVKAMQDKQFKNLIIQELLPELKKELKLAEKATSRALPTDSIPLSNVASGDSISLANSNIYGTQGIGNDRQFSFATLSRTIQKMSIGSISIDANRDIAITTRYKEETGLPIQLFNGFSLNTVSDTQPPFDYQSKAGASVLVDSGSIIPCFNESLYIKGGEAYRYRVLDRNTLGGLRNKFTYYESNVDQPTGYFYYNPQEYNGSTFYFWAGGYGAGWLELDGSDNGFTNLNIETDFPFYKDIIWDLTNGVVKSLNGRTLAGTGSRAIGNYDNGKSESWEFSTLQYLSVNGFDPADARIVALISDSSSNIVYSTSNYTVNILDGYGNLIDTELAGQISNPFGRSNVEIPPINNKLTFNAGNNLNTPATITGRWFLRL